MSTRSLPELPNNQELIMYFQQEPALSTQAFAVLYERFLPFIQKKRPPDTCEDDWEDIVSEFWIRVWNKLSTFEYRNESKLRGWLCKVLKSVAGTYWRKESRLRLKQLSLDRETTSSDGSTTTIGESLSCSCELFDDPEDWEQRECVKVAARQCLSNEEQVMLFEARMDNIPDQLARPDNWKNVYWHRGKKKVIETCRKNTTC